MRADRICSTFTDLNKELSFLVNYFFRNGYPKWLIYKQIRNFMKKTTHPRQSVLTVERKKLYLSFPYFGKHSEKLKDEI